MRAGQKIGGKIATPIRQMLSSDEYNCVVFRCGTVEHAENTRVAALILKLRNNYDIRTSRRDGDLYVYRDEGLYDSKSLIVYNYKED